jgi:hypothetical protein
MKLKSVLLLTVMIALVVPLVLVSGNAGAAQNYYGDGATYSGGGWTTSQAASNQCLFCHKIGGGATDESGYLMGGHKNMLRKVAPNAPWNGLDGTTYQTTDIMYQSGSTYDWSLGTIVVGGCLPLSVAFQLGLGLSIDSTCSYPNYNSTQNIFYIFGGWTDKTALNTIFNSGFTGEQYPNGNYDCGRCHTTGYRYDNSGPEPTYLGTPITDAQFSRWPTDFTSGTSSWHLDGIQCERCHNADNGTNNHTATGAIGGGIPTKPLNQSGTALCLECHREETADATLNTINPGEPLPGGGYSYLIAYDGGYCSDLTSPDYPTCTAAGQTWNYSPFIDHESGPTFLSSPHARFSGTLTQNAQNSPDSSVNMTGTYNSAFTDPVTGENKGCMGCHDPHLTPDASTTPFVKNCADCHTTTAQSLYNELRHPKGVNTPFPTGTLADIPDSCVVCHMPSSYHLMRISVDPNYSTFPTPDQLYLSAQTTPNTASDGKLASAVWVDVDLACGQCHVGSGTIGFTTPAAGAPPISKADLAMYAQCMHSDPALSYATIHATANANGSISSSGTTTVSSGSSPTFTITPDPGYQVLSVIVDGENWRAKTTYSFTNITGCHTIIASFKEITYTITTSAGANGSISPVGTLTFSPGASQTFTITPTAGYHVADVSVDGGSVGAVTTYPFTNITANHTISATFAANSSYTITASADANSTISPAGTVNVLSGANRTFTITPAAGYRVVDVLVDGTSVAARTSYTFYNVTAMHTISVSSALNVYTITATVASGGGSITPSGTITLNPGATQTFTMTGGTVRSVFVDGANWGARTTFTFTNIVANHTISVYFK